MPTDNTVSTLPSRSPGGVQSTTTDNYRTNEVEVIAVTPVKKKGMGVLSALSSILSFKAQPIQDTVSPNNTKDNSGLYIVGAILLIFGAIFLFSKMGKK